MSSQQVISPSNFYFINVDGANNRRKLFNNSEYTTNSNIFQRKGSDGLDIGSFTQDFNPFENILSNQSLKNKDVEISHRLEQVQNSRLELGIDMQQSRNLEQSQIDKDHSQIEKVDIQKRSRVNEIARTKSKKEINYNDIQQIIQSNQKKGTQYIQQRMKTFKQNKNGDDDEDDDNAFHIGNGVAAEYYEYENNQVDEVVNTLKNDEVVTEGNKLKNQIIIFSYLLQFVKALLVRYMYKESKMLSVLQYRIIGDNSIVIEKSQKKIIEEIQSVKHRNIFERINFIREINYAGTNSKYNKNSFTKQLAINIALVFKKILTTLSKSLIVLKPNNPIVIIWEGFFLIAILFFLLIIPLEWSFDFTDSEQQVFRYMNYMQAGVFILDTVIGFRTGFYEFGEIVMSRSRVVNKYFKEKFKPSLISTSLIFLNLIINFQPLNFIALLIMANSISEKVEKINLNLQLYQKLSNYLELGKLFLLILLSIHVFGCGFHFVGRYSEQNCITDNWINNLNLKEKTIGEKYVNSIYFAMISMVTIGYGDIKPINVYEKMYVLGMAFISCALFAFSVNLIGSTITDIKKKSKEFRHKQYLISCYMTDRQVQKATQMRVLKYLEFIEDFRDQNITEGAKILEQCSQEIKEELLKEYFGRILKNSKLFKGTFSKEFLTQLSLIMRERRFAPGEILVQKGQQMKQLYFVTKGQTEYFFANNENFMNICDYDEKMVDLKSFITQQPSDVSIRSKGITTVAFIDFTQWQDIIKYFQSDMVKLQFIIQLINILFQQSLLKIILTFKYYKQEKSCCLRDQFLYDKRYQYPCKSCGQYQHNIFNCPQVCFKVNKTSFFHKLSHHVPQETRTPFTRRDKKRQISSYTNNEIIRQGLKLLRWQLVRDIFEDYEETDIQQECAMIERDREFFLRCPKIKLSYFKKKEKQRYIVLYNTSDIKLKSRQMSKQKSESNFFYNQKVTSSSSSSSNITSSDSDDSNSSSDSEDKDQTQQEQNNNNSNNNNTISTSNNNPNQLNMNLNQNNPLLIDSKVEQSDIQGEGGNNANQYQKKLSSEIHLQTNFYHPRLSKTVRTPKSSRVDIFEAFSQNINNPPYQGSQLQNNIFESINNQKNNEENLYPSTFQVNYPQQQLIIADKVVNQRRSILSNGNNKNIRDLFQNNFQPPQSENTNNLRFNLENTRSLKEEENGNIQGSSQINSLNTPQQQDPGGSPIINLNQLFSQFQYQVQGLYYQIQGLQNNQNQFFPSANVQQQQINNKKKKKPVARFNLPQNMMPNEKTNQDNIFKENVRQASLSSLHNMPKDQIKENSKVEFLSYNDKQKLHLFGKFEFYFDYPREFQFYYPKYNQSNIIKAYKKYQTMIVNQYKESLTMSKKATTMSRAVMYQSTRRKYPKKQSLAHTHTKNKKSIYIN